MKHEHRHQNDANLCGAFLGIMTENSFHPAIFVPLINSFDPEPFSGKDDMRGH